MGCWAMVGDYSKDSSSKDNLNLLLRLTRVEASVDLKRQVSRVFRRASLKTRDAGGFLSNSWQQLVV